MYVAAHSAFIYLFIYFIYCVWMSMLLFNWLLEVKVTPQKVECEMMKKFILYRQVHIFIFYYFFCFAI